MEEAAWREGGKGREGRREDGRGKDRERAGERECERERNNTILDRSRKRQHESTVKVIRPTVAKPWALVRSGSPRESPM